MRTVLVTWRGGESGLESLPAAPRFALMPYGLRVVVIGPGDHGAGIRERSAAEALGLCS
ncbi:hypothetical protein ABZ897_04565 [Nonomuraea sp. NPDC046802]|uniref:hypothetical protein n=1 Tax=Nonomuraea sp. NPDC046802 TaxID=3154919 RepID=UPI0033FC26FD